MLTLLRVALYFFYRLKNSYQHHCHCFMFFHLEYCLEFYLGSVSTVSSSDSPTINIGESLAELVGKIRESISVKAAAKVVAFQGVVGTYVHGATAQHPTVGSAAAVVSLSSSEPLDEAKTALLKPYAKRLAMHVVAAKPRWEKKKSEIGVNGYG